MGMFYVCVKELQVGFVGLGNMGGHMARNLVKGGHDLNVFDREPNQNAVNQICSFQLLCEALDLGQSLAQAGIG